MKKSKMKKKKKISNKTKRLLREFAGRGGRRDALYPRPLKKAEKKSDYRVQGK